MAAPNPGDPWVPYSFSSGDRVVGFAATGSGTTITGTFTGTGVPPIESRPGLTMVVNITGVIPAARTITSVVDSKGNTYTEIPNSGVIVGTEIAFPRYQVFNLWMAYVDTKLVPGDTLTVTFSGSITASTLYVQTVGGLLKTRADSGASFTYSSAQDAVPGTTYAQNYVSRSAILGVPATLTTPDQPYRVVVYTRNAFWVPSTHSLSTFPYPIEGGTYWWPGGGNGVSTSGRAFIWVAGFGRYPSSAAGIYNSSAGNATAISFEPGGQGGADSVNTYKAGAYLALLTTQNDSIYYSLDDVKFRAA